MVFYKFTWARCHCLWLKVGPSNWATRLDTRRALFVHKDRTQSFGLSMFSSCFCGELLLATLERVLQWIYQRTVPDECIFRYLIYSLFIRFFIKLKKKRNENHQYEARLRRAMVNEYAVQIGI